MVNLVLVTFIDYVNLFGVRWESYFQYPSEAKRSFHMIRYMCIHTHTHIYIYVYYLHIGYTYKLDTLCKYYTIL